MTHLASGYPGNAKRAICGAALSDQARWKSVSATVDCGACLAKNATAPPGKKWEG
jgi:hypothetical protein